MRSRSRVRWCFRGAKIDHRLLRGKTAQKGSKKWPFFGRRFWCRVCSRWISPKSMKFEASTPKSCRTISLSKHTHTYIYTIAERVTCLYKPNRLCIWHRGSIMKFNVTRANYALSFSVLLFKSQFKQLGKITTDREYDFSIFE